MTTELNNCVGTNHNHSCGIEIFVCRAIEAMGIIPMNNTFKPPVSFSSARLLSLAKSSLTENSGKFVAGTHPDTNPEQAPGLFSALLTGEKALSLCGNI